MRKIKYSKDVDVLLIELSDKPIDYAEEQGRIIIHFSKDGEPVLIEILDAKEFVLSSIASVIQEKEVALTLWGNKCLMSKPSSTSLMNAFEKTQAWLWIGEKHNADFPNRDWQIHGKKRSARPTGS